MPATPAKPTRWAAWIVGMAALALTGPATILVSPAADLHSVLRSATPGTNVELAPGTFEGPVVIERAVNLTGAPGTKIVASDDGAAIVVEADGSSIRSLETTGGSTGIAVAGADDIVLRDVTIRAADLHGIEIVEGSATVSGAVVEGLRDRYAQGIEIRNSLGHPRTTVTGSQVNGGQEGIVSHVARVSFANNSVTNTTMRAIAVTEMSIGTVRRNRVTEVIGSGLYCGDMSRCRFDHNVVSHVEGDGTGVRSVGGWGLVAHFHSTASSTGDLFEDTAAGARTALTGSRFVDLSAMTAQRGWMALLQVGIAAAIAALIVALAFAATRRLLSPLGSKVRSSAGGAWTVAVDALLVVGIAVQSFHMSEHVVQVARVHGDGVPSRGGLLGPFVEAEWLHLAYNSAVLVGLAALVLARRRGWRRNGASSTADRFLVVAVVVQGYHLVEHSVKIGQHLATGAKVNPGILGGGLDLVWLHFTINLAVYAAFLLAARGIFAGPSRAPLMRGRPVTD